MHANTIFVLEKGHIVESGSHLALLETKGLYYAMWRQQIGERSSWPGSKQHEAEPEEAENDKDAQMTIFNFGE